MALAGHFIQSFHGQALHLGTSSGNVGMQHRQTRFKHRGLRLLLGGGLLMLGGIFSPAEGRTSFRQRRLCPVQSSEPLRAA